MAPDPLTPTEALALVGESYSKRGDYQQGLEADLTLSRLRPDSGVVHYNLACSYALLKKKDSALEALAQAIELGYRDLDHLRKDRDLEFLHDDPRYQALLLATAFPPKKRSRGSVDSKE